MSRLKIFSMIPFLGPLYLAPPDGDIVVEEFQFRFCHFDVSSFIVCL